MSAPNLYVTLCPSFKHFADVVRDERVAGIRVNSAMLSVDDVARELALPRLGVPLMFDVKGRQLRVTEAIDDPSYCDLRINHPIEVDTPTVVLLKSGADRGVLGQVLEDGRRLRFSANPEYRVHPGESLHIRHPSLKVGGSLFTDAELEKIEVVKGAGIDQWFLSYVDNQRDVERFREVVGRDAQLFLKIESKSGLEFASSAFRKDENTRLVAACGDLYVELDRPHHVYAALEMIAQRDPEAIAGSRMLLSLVQEPVPSLADLAQLGWLYELGYRSFMLCDELCLRGDRLAAAINVFSAFRDSYPRRPAVPSRSAAMDALGRGPAA